MKKDKQNFVVINLTGSQDINQITTDIENASVSKLEGNSWTITIDYEDFKDADAIRVTVYDEAGNSTEKSVNLTSIKGVANNKILEYSDPSSRLVFGIDKVGLRRSINMVFVLFILSLIVIDYFALTRMSIDHTIPKKHVGNHFSIFAILLFIAFAGGTTGELLNGVNS